MTLIESFLSAIDDAFDIGTASGPITLQIIGSTALMLQASYERGTKDSDVLETNALSATVRAELERIGGKGSRLAHKHRLYVEVIPQGLPFLPPSPRFLALDQLNARLRHLRLEVLDVTDVAVSKLKRLNGNDRQDIDAMIDLDLLMHDALVERFRAAVDAYSMDARAEDLPRYVKNLHQVERDLFCVPESEIDLPTWL